MESREVDTDMVFEILSRVSLQTLGKCRLLNKECNSLTYESTFMHFHYLRTKTVSGYFVQSVVNAKYVSTFVSINNPNLEPKLSLNFLPGSIKIEACAPNQGIMLCVDPNPRNTRIPIYYICKPSTRQWQVIPNPKTRYFTERTVMMVLRSNPLRYKIVRFSRPKCGYTSRFNNTETHLCEIFDSKIWAWKKSNDVKLPYCEFFNFGPAVFACGGFHWVTSKDNIFAFYPDKENWIMFSLPKINESDCIKYKTLVEYEGKLGLMRERRDDCIELWVMQDYTNRAWSKRLTINIEEVNRKDKLSFARSFYGADIAMLTGFYKVIFYNFKNGSIEDVTLEKQDFPKEIFPFYSDLERVNLMGKEEIQEYSRPQQLPKSISRPRSFMHRFGGYLELASMLASFVSLVCLFALFVSLLKSLEWIYFSLL